MHSALDPNSAAAALASLPSPVEMERLAAALGQAARVSYAPPNIYPMSAPAFAPGRGKTRACTGAGELGLYVHVPYCNYSCTFCFYATRLTPPREKMEQYVEALLEELHGVPVGSPLAQLYVGGGTPTTLPPALLDRLLQAVFARLRRTSGPVHTVETSPESITPEHVEVLKAHGIERVSMGVQSLQGDVLDTVKRRHAADQALAACDLLVQSGLLVNIDLIYGLPGQPPDGFCRDFEALASRGVSSVTAYNLRINERTPVGREVTELERLDLASLMRWRAIIRAKAAELGFEQTRWHTFRRRLPAHSAASAAARFVDRTGEGNQFGIGVSARSRLDHVVYRNHANYETYLERIGRGESPVEETIELGDTERKLRFVALTLGDGRTLSRADYQREFGTRCDDDFHAAIEQLVEAGLVREEPDEIHLTDTGKLLYDLVTRAFYPGKVRHWMDVRQDLAHTAANLRPRTEPRKQPLPA
jgi:oxygen-independent coproporphyrinogen-3 oxidase